MGKKIIIYDTTLRDGMQGLGVNFSLKDKIEITEKLDEMKVDYIEGGFPMASDKEAAFFEEFRKKTIKIRKTGGIRIYPGTEQKGRIRPSYPGPP